MEEHLQAFLEYLQEEYKYSKNTIAAYKNDLSQFTTYLGKGTGITSDVSTVTANIVDGYVDYMKNQSYASSSVARKVAAVKSFFNYLFARGIINENPTTNISSPKVKKRLPQPLTSDEVERLLDAPTNSSKQTPKNLRDTALLKMLYATGMRVTEIVSLQLNDVEMETGTILCPGKDDQIRKLPIDDDTKEVVEQYLEDGRPFLVKDKNEQSLFLNHRGQQLTRQGLWLIIKAYTKEANLSAEVTPHTLRHSFAAHKLANGTELQEVQRLLGHANISTTQIYTQQLEEAQQP